MRRSLVFILLLGCGDGPGGRPRSEPTLETFERRMCACRDVTCVRQVVVDMAAWSQKARVPRDVERTEQIMARYNACMTDASR